MAAIDFPNAPAVNDIFTSGSKSWQWDGITWNLLSTVVVNSITGTASQVLVNTTTGSAQSGALTLATPQDIATTSTPTFGSMTLNQAGGGSKLSLSGATSNWIEYSTVGVAAPTLVTARSAGTKVVLYPAFSNGVSADYAIGIDGVTQWYSVPKNTTEAVLGDYFFKWYGGSTLVMSLNAVSGALTTTGTVQGTRLISTVTTGNGAPFTVSSTDEVASLRAATATKWTTGRTIALTGNVTGTSGTFDGSANLSFATTIAAGVITSAMLSTTTGDPGGSWNTFTQATAGVAQGNVTSGNCNGEWIQIGKWVFFWIQVSAGTATAGGRCTVVLPTAAPASKTGGPWPAACNVAGGGVQFTPAGARVESASKTVTYSAGGGANWATGNTVTCGITGFYPTA